VSSRARPEFAIALAAVGVLLAIGVPAWQRGDAVRGGACIGLAIAVAAWFAFGPWRARRTVPVPGAAPIDWKRVEDTLVACVTQSLAGHIAAHPDEEFSGLCLDCTSRNAEVRVCLDPRASRVPDWIIDAWPHRGINLGSAEWRRDWAWVEAAMAGAMAHRDQGGEDGVEALAGEFMIMASRALLRIEHAPVLDGRRAAGFAALCLDRDEAPSAAIARRSRIVHGGTRGSA
jgi:hypothetical protein